MTRTRPTATITIGCPASGKSTFAETISSTGAQIIERDRIRVDLAGTKRAFYKAFPSNVGESAVSGIVRQKLLNCAKKGTSVIVSDTNTNQSLRHRLYSDLFDMGFKVQVVLFDVALEELLDRNEKRPVDDQVPVHVIERMHAAMQKQRELLAKEATVLNYRIGDPADSASKPCAVFDIDGTIADHQGLRSPYDWHQVHLDRPRSEVIAFMKDYERVVFMSGRDGACREATLEWISKNTGIDDPWLGMRPEGSMLPDWIVKGEMMKSFIEHSGMFPSVVFDDRQQVVNIWNNMGLQVIQVQQGKF